MNKFKSLSLQDLSILHKESQQANNQYVLNAIALEITRRLYIKNPQMSFLDMSEYYGYKRIEIENSGL